MNNCFLLKTFVQCGKNIENCVQLYVDKLHSCGFVCFFTKESLITCEIALKDVEMMLEHTFYGL